MTRLVEDAAEPARCEAHFADRLAFYTDPFDLHAELERGEDGVVVLFCADRDFYEAHHVPGAHWLHYRDITPGTVDWPKDTLIVVYGKGGACNVGPKAALRLARLGYRVKELDGGMTQWMADGFPVSKGVEP